MSDKKDETKRLECFGDATMSDYCSACPDNEACATKTEIASLQKTLDKVHPVYVEEQFKPSQAEEETATVLSSLERTHQKEIDELNLKIKNLESKLTKVQALPEMWRNTNALDSRDCADRLEKVLGRSVFTQNKREEVEK